MLRRLLILLAFVFFSSAPAFAKKITIEWAPEKQAVFYEIQVEDSSGKKHVKRRVDESQYKGNLKPGVYFWQIRAIDRLKRPGRWSDSEPLVVMAAPPALLTPESDSDLTLFHPSESVTFKWDVAPGATAYLFKLSKEGATILEKELTGNTFETPIPDTGEYTWTVHSVLTPGSGAPTAFHSRRWQSDAASPSPLNIEQKKLAQAKIIEPTGVISMPDKPTLRFAWSAVDDADSYEVRLESNQPSKAGGHPTEKIYRTKKTSINVNLRDLGIIEEAKRHIWSVRAIPRRAPANYDRDSSAVGVSKTDFQFSTEMRDHLRRGSIELNTFLAPTSHRFAAPDSGQAGETASITSGFRISGDRYPGGRFGYGGSLERSTFQIAGQTYSTQSLELGIHYRKAPSANGSGWLLNARLGLGMRDYVEIFPSVFVDTNTQTVTITGSNDLSVTTLGPASGVVLKRFLTDRWTVQFNFSHYLPIMKMGSSDVGALESVGILDNSSLAVRGGWESRTWGYTFGIVRERRSLKFNRTLANGSVSSQTDETSSSSWSLFGGVSYSFY